MSRVLRHTGLHDERDPRNQKAVRLGSEFHADLLFWKWPINHKILHAGEAVSVPCYTALERPAKRYYLSDASFEAVGGYCREGFMEIRSTARSDDRTKTKGRPA